MHEASSAELLVVLRAVAVAALCVLEEQKARSSWDRCCSGTRLWGWDAPEPRSHVELIYMQPEY